MWKRKSMLISSRVALLIVTVLGISSSSANNEISAKPGTQLISELDINDVKENVFNASFWFERGNIQAGTSMYGDKNIKINMLPGELAGCDWIQTADGSKHYTDSTLAVFDLNADAHVYIAHDKSIPAKPAWLSSFTPTGQHIHNSESTIFQLYRKSFDKGDQIALGPNGDTEKSMYIVIVQPVGVVPALPVPTNELFDIREYGAKGDGKTVNTAAIQNAIDACASAGGGSVFIHDGIYLSGTLILKDNVTLYVQAGSILRGTRNPNDYPPQKCELKSFRDNENLQFIYAEKAANITITGGGIIDGQDTGINPPWAGDVETRPRLIRMIECNDIVIRNITLVRSCSWLQYYEGCENLLIENCRIRAYTGQHNQDGIDISGTANATVRNCYIISGDDAICLKSMSMKKTRDIHIYDNQVKYSHCFAVKIGTETHYGVENVTVRNIVGNARYGLAIQTTDGAMTNNILYENITLTECTVPISIRLGKRNREFKGGPDPVPIGKMSNITIRNITNTGVRFVVDKEGPGIACSISGIPERDIENVVIEDCNFLLYGSIQDKQLIYTEVPEKEKAYPNFHIFGKLPCYGMFVRHVDGFKLKNINFSYKYPDVRPAIILDDVDNYTLSGINCQTNPKTKPYPVWDKQSGKIDVD